MSVSSLKLLLQKISRSVFLSLCSLNHIQHFITLSTGIFSCVLHSYSCSCTGREQERDQVHPHSSVCVDPQKSKVTEVLRMKQCVSAWGNACVSVHVDSGYCASSGLFYKTVDCVFFKSHIAKQLSWQVFLFFISCSFIFCLLSSFTLSCQVPSPCCYFLSLFWNICS